MVQFLFNNSNVCEQITAEKLKMRILDYQLRNPVILSKNGIPVIDLEIAYYYRYSQNKEDYDLSNIGRTCLDVLINYTEGEIKQFTVYPNGLTENYPISLYKQDITKALSYMYGLELLSDFVYTENLILFNLSKGTSFECREKSRNGVELKSRCDLINSDSSLN